MLLNLSARMKTHSSGSALVAVIGVMAAGLLIVLLVASIVTAALTYSSVTRAGVESQAAAEGGIAVATAALNNDGQCEAAAGVFTSTSDPIYRATVWRSTDGTTWTQGCPITTTQQIRIISSGDARDRGVSGATAGNRRFVEAIYSYGIVDPGTQLPGAAMYFYVGSKINQFQITATSGTPSDIAVPDGDFSCTQSAVAGTINVSAGSASITNYCAVTGSIRATGTVSIKNSSSVSGDVSSSTGGVSLSGATPSVGGSISANGSVDTVGPVGGSVSAVGQVNISAGAPIGGNLTSGSAVTLSSSVVGSLTTVGNLTISGGGSVGGNILIGGTLKYGKLTNAAAATALKSAGRVGGTILYRQAGVVAPAPPAAPVVPPWTDVAYNFSQWQQSGFATELIWPAALGCKLGTSASTSPSGSLYPFWNQVSNLTTPTVVDARPCSSVSGDLTLALKTDVAFIATDFDVSSLTVTSADGAPHRIWFIIPDAQPAVAGPQCPQSGGEFSLQNASAIGVNISAMAYTPCSINLNNGLQWRGQVYASSMSIGGGPRILDYASVGIPGSLIGGGSAGNAIYAMGDLVSQRNRTDSGE